MCTRGYRDFTQANDYQRLALRTSPHATSMSMKERGANAAMGLAGEAGEVVDSYKKHLFQGHPLDAREICNELGDILWYVALMCDTHGLQMSEVMEANLTKLAKRYPDGFSVERSVNRSE